MKIFIVYCHPSKDSFTNKVFEEFKKGLTDGGHKFIVSDLYEMNFMSDMSFEEYLRESKYSFDLPVPEDVLIEHEKINSSDAIVFIYPVWWSDCPAKLKGWFDRVLTVGFAYGTERTSMPQSKKVLFLCTAGHQIEYLSDIGISKSMETIALVDRIGSKARESQMIILGGMVQKDVAVMRNNLAKAYFAGRDF
ncbi:MAG: NAD(P)H-dependent oxidoreductase [Bacillota bacterium]